ncbi:hypothetical protein [Caldimonas tepidiphila]|uniref:hypothetical protein n=1 Tax=Caldimonas tepidiphila TaxID=2315841 RepID=UPI000E5C07CC|nr:hypothetical protein [Caldimonas tepidiphila]
MTRNRHFRTGALLLGLCGAAHATLDAELRVTRDSDDFSERMQALEWRAADSGFGLRVGALRYEAPGWRADGRLLAGVLERRGERSRLRASAGVLDLEGRTHGVGALDYLWQVSEGSALGVSAERSHVGAVRSIERGITFDHLALVGEHRFGPRFEVGVAAGVARFSNDNTRRQLRTRWTRALAGDGGLHLYLKTRNHWNSDPYRPEYFSPDRLHEASLGLSSRLRLGPSVVFSAEADAGRQRTELSSKPLWGYSVGLASPHTSRVSWRVALQATNAAASSSASADGYRHAGLTARLSLPF